MIIVFLAVMLACCGSVRAEPVSNGALPVLVQGARFVAYTPRSFAITAGGVIPASANGIRADLALLRPYFNGLITYSANNGMEAVPAIARELGFRAVILGMWDPLSEEEFRNLVQATRRFPSLVAAVVVGNEGIYTKRYQAGDVQKTVARLRRECPSLAVTTSEPFFLYFQPERKEFFKGFDLLMPNVHPVFEPWFKPGDPGSGVTMVLNVAAQFKASYDRPLLLKETGMPSGPDTGQTGFTPGHQAQFWAELMARFPASANQALACFEAFDEPWKPVTIGAEFPGDHAKEAFWGFFTVSGEGKEVIKVLPELRDAK